METLEIRAADGIPLAASYFPPQGPPKAAVLINSATAVDRRYYRAFAEWLAARGHAVLSYDYRGIAGSRPQRLRRDFPASITLWGERDCSAAAEALAQRAPKEADGGALPLLLIGHSIGGVVVASMPDNQRFAAILTVGAQSAYYRDWPAPVRGRMVRQWHLILPLLTPLFGYFPAKRLGLMEDLPAGVARQFHARRRHPDWLRLLEREGLASYHQQVRAPVLAIGIADDPYGTRDATLRHHRLFENAPVEYRWIAPAEIGESEIGHFGFFRRRYQPTLWPLAAEWLEAQAARAQSAGQSSQMRPSE